MSDVSPAAGAVPRGEGLLSRAFVTLCLVCFLNHFLIAPFSSLFPVYVEADLQRLPWFTGYLRGIMLALGGVFAIVAGRMCDVLGRKATLLLGLAGSLLTGLVFRTVDPLGLTGLIFLMGAATGLWSTAGQSYLIGSVGPRRLGLGGALYFLSNTAGNSLGSLVTGLIKAHWSFAQIGLGMVAALVVLLAVGVVLLPGGDRKRGHHTAGSTERSGLWAAYQPLLARREVHLLIGLRYMITTFWGMASLLLPLLIYRVSQSASMPAFYAAVSLAAAAACQLLTGLLTDRYGRTGPLLIATAGVALSALGLALFQGVLPGLFLCGTALTGTAWAVSTIIPRLMSDVARAEEKNRLVGLTHLVWSGAMVTGSIAGGLLVEVEPALPFLTGVVLAAGGALCAWRLCLHLELAER